MKNPNKSVHTNHPQRGSFRGIKIWLEYKHARSTRRRQWLAGDLDVLQENTFMSARHKKLVLNLCLVFSAACWISYLISFYYFHNGHLPTLPQPETGRIYESNNHGSFVYLTLSEELFGWGLFFSTFLFFYLAYQLNERWKIWTYTRQSIN